MKKILKSAQILVSVVLFISFLIFPAILCADEYIDCYIISSDSGYVMDSGGFQKNSLRIGKRSNGGTYRPVLVFDTSAIPNDAEILDVSIYIRCTETASGIRAYVWDLYSPMQAGTSLYSDAGSGTKYSSSWSIGGSTGLTSRTLNSAGEIGVKNSLSSNRFLCGITPHSGYEGSDYAKFDNTNAYLHVRYTIPGNCSYSISPSSYHCDFSRQTGSYFNVETQSGCAWNSSTNYSWIELNTYSGLGPNKVYFNIKENTSSSSRTGTITAAGNTFSITQDGVEPCTYSLSGSTTNIGRLGGSGIFQVNVLTGTNCSWTALSNKSWIHTSSSSTGTGKINYTVDANQGDARSGIITVEGKTFTINQEGVCTYSINPVSGNFDSETHNDSFSVTTQSGCSWTAVSNNSWIHTSSTGTGNGTVQYSIDANTGAARSGSLSIGGKTFTINQEAPVSSPSPDLISVTGIPSEIRLGGSFTLTIEAKNLGGLSPEGYITTSLTEDPGISDKSAPGMNLVDKTPGSEIINKYGNKIISTNRLVEGYDIEWTFNETHSLSYKVTPTKIGLMYIYIRTTMKDNNSNTWMSDVSVSNGDEYHNDQQEWLCRRFSVDVLDKDLKHYFGDRGPQFNLNVFGKTYSVIEFEKDNCKITLPFDKPYESATIDDIITDDLLARYLLLLQATNYHLKFTNTNIEDRIDKELDSIKEAHDLNGNWYADDKMGVMLLAGPVLQKTVFNKRVSERATIGATAFFLANTVVKAKLSHGASLATFPLELSTFITDLATPVIDEDEVKALILYYQFLGANETNLNKIRLQLGLNDQKYRDLVNLSIDAFGISSDVIGLTLGIEELYLASKSGISNLTQIDRIDAGITAAYSLMARTISHVSGADSFEEEVKAWGVVHDEHSDAIFNVVLELQKIAADIISQRKQSLSSVSLKSLIEQENQFAFLRAYMLPELMAELYFSQYFHIKRVRDDVWLPLAWFGGASKKSLDIATENRNDWEGDRNLWNTQFVGYHNALKTSYAQYLGGIDRLNEILNRERTEFQFSNSNYLQLNANSSISQTIYIENTSPEDITNIQITPQSPFQNISFSFSNIPINLSSGDKRTLTLNATVPYNWFSQFNNTKLVNPYTRLPVTISYTYTLNAPQNTNSQIQASTKTEKKQIDVLIIPPGKIKSIDTQKMEYQIGDRVNFNVQFDLPNPSLATVIINCYYPDGSNAGLGGIKTSSRNIPAYFDLTKSIYGSYGIGVWVADELGNLLLPEQTIPRAFNVIPPISGVDTLNYSNAVLVGKKDGDEQIVIDLAETLSLNSSSIIWCDGLSADSLLGQINGKDMILVGGQQSNPIVKKLILFGKLPGNKWQSAGQASVNFIQSPFQQGQDLVVIAGNRARDTEVAGTSYATQYHNALSNTTTSSTSSSTTTTSMPPDITTTTTTPPSSTTTTTSTPPGTSTTSSVPTTSTTSSSTTTSVPTVFPSKAYGFNEGSGTAFLEETGGGNNGILYNGPIWVPSEIRDNSGSTGTAVQYDGVNDYGRLSAQPITDGPFTIMFWVKKLGPGGGSGWIQLIRTGAPGSKNGYCIYWFNDNSIQSFICTASGYPWLSFQNAPENEWVHVALSYDKSKTKLYINGNLEEEASQTGALVAPNWPFSIGGQGPGTDAGYFNGLMDGLKVYTSGLEMGEIQAVYNAEKPQEPMTSTTTTSTPIVPTTTTTTSSTIPPTTTTIPGGSPGGRVVFVSDRGGNQNLWILDLATMQTHQLTNFPSQLNVSYIYYPKWSPDGKKISFGARISGTQYAEEIYMISDEGTNLTKLTNYPDSYTAYLSVWHPTNNDLLYYTKIYPASSGVVHQLNIISLVDFEIPNSSGQNTHYFDVTTDGTEILFSREPSCCWTPTMYTGYQDMNGQNQRIIKPTDNNSEWVGRINRTDNWIAYHEATGFSSPVNIYKMDKDGNNVTKLTQGTGSERNSFPVWTSGGNNGNIIFQSTHFGNSEITMMPATANAYPSDIINITNNSANDKNPDWTLTSGIHEISTTTSIFPTTTTTSIPIIITTTTSSSSSSSTSTTTSSSISSSTTTTTIRPTCGDISIVLSPSSGSTNNEVEVRILIADNQNPINALGTQLHFDTSMFAYQSVTPGNLTNDWAFIDAQQSSGILTIGGLAGSGTTIPSQSSGTIVVLKFKVIGDCNTFQGGEESRFWIDDYVDGIACLGPLPAEAFFTLNCCIGDISLSFDPASGTWGSKTDAQISITNNLSPISSFGVDFVYDTTMFNYLGVEKGTLTTGWTNVDGNEISPGKVKIGGLVGGGTAIPANSTGSLAKVNLQVKCVTYANNTESINRIENYLDDIAGLCPVPASSIFTYKTCPVLGDVNGDGKKTPGDAQKAFDIYLGRITPDSCQMVTSDANCSGSTTPGDAQAIFDDYLQKNILPDCCTVAIQGLDSIELSQPQAFVYPSESRVSMLDSIGKPGERVIVPVFANQIDSIGSFSFEVVYPTELLRYMGTKNSPQTEEFNIDSAESIEGLIRIEGYSELPQRWTDHGALALLVFEVKEERGSQGIISVYNLGGDIIGSKAQSGIFVCEPYQALKEKTITLGIGRFLPDGTIAIPVEISHAFGIKAFGMELSYNIEDMQFLGVKSTAATAGFIALESNEIEPGLVKVGGYSSSGIQDKGKREILYLIFVLFRDTEGAVDVINLVDDIADFMVKK